MKTKAQRARDVMRKYPRLTPAAVAKRAGVDVQTVYRVRSTDKKCKPDTRRYPGLDQLVKDINGEFLQQRALKQVLREIAEAVGK